LSAVAISLSAVVRSPIASVMTAAGSEKVTVVGAPVLVAASFRVTPGIASETVFEVAVIASPSMRKAASLAVPSNWPLAEPGVQASADNPGSSGSSAASRTKPLAAPSLPLSTSCAPSTVCAT
jgi:hypothetical protein